MQAKTATTRQGRFKTTLVMSHPDTAATSIIRDLKQKHTLTPLGWDVETRVSEWAVTESVSLPVCLAVGLG